MGSSDSARAVAKAPGVSAALIRQWWILSLLPKAPQKVDSARLVAALRERGVTAHRRTIQRDLLELATVFPIVADERTKPYGWRWASDAHPALPLVVCPRCGAALV